MRAVRILGLNTNVLACAIWSVELMQITAGAGLRFLTNMLPRRSEWHVLRIMQSMFVFFPPRSEVSRSSSNLSISQGYCSSSKQK